MKHAFTIDFEDWYQGIGIPQEQWRNFEKRLRIGHEHLMSVLAKHNTKATFFVVGKVLEDHPELIQEIISEGHEVGCHTYSHPLLFTLTPDQFTEEIRKCVALAQQYNIQYKGFRAPYFSIDERCLWTLDILKSFNFLYDTSIYPGDNKRSGIKDYPKTIHILENGLLEVPISTFKLYKFDVGLGGAYFRILPYTLFKKKMKKIAKERPGIFYIHPWELDPHHPRLSSLTPRIRYPHYFNLSSTKEKLNRLFGDFEFTTLHSILAHRKAI